MVVLYIAFTNYFYFRYLKQKEELIEWSGLVGKSFFASLGDFGDDPTEGWDNWDEYIAFIVTILMMCLVMLNLLIGIISSEMEKILET
jgi:hypothetical protein